MTDAVDEKKDAVEGEVKETLDESIHAVLKEHGISSADDVEGLISDLGKFKKEYGRSQNDNGELRRRVQELESKIQHTANDYSETDGIDIAGAIRSAVRAELEDFQKHSREVAKKQNAERMKIMSQPDWKIVGPRFEAAMRSPVIGEAIASGQVTPMDVYQNIRTRVLVSEYDKLANQLPKGSLTPDMSGVDTSERVSQKLPPNMELKRAREAAIKNRDPDALLKTIIGDNDPILSRG